MPRQTVKLAGTVYEVLTFDEWIDEIARGSPLAYPLPCLPLTEEQTWVSDYPTSPND